mgnify:CR=1 FL=1
MRLLLVADTFPPATISGALRKVLDRGELTLDGGATPGLLTSWTNSPTSTRSMSGLAPNTRVIRRSPTTST